MTKKILILVANSKNTSRQQFEEQVREIDNGLQRAQHRDQFELVQRWAVRPRDIQRAMLDVKPQIVHFLGRAAGSQERELENESDQKLVPCPEDATESEGLVFEDESGQVKLVRGQALAELCKLFADKLMCVVLNGCYSKEQAEEIAKYIPYVVGTKQVIGNKAAINFAVGFYDALGAGRSVADAYEFGCVVIKFQFERFSEDLKPLLHKKKYSIQHIQPKRDKSERLEDHYESIIKAIIRGRMIPFLGSDINLCDRPIQKNGELEPWEPGCPFPPSGKELAAYFAKTFPPQLEKIIYYEQKKETGRLQEADPRIKKKDHCINKVIYEHAILIYPDNTEEGSLHVGGEPLQYLSQYADLTQKGKFYDQLEQVELNKRYQPNQLHKFFATLPGIMREKGYYPPYPLIITTNYDISLEQAFVKANEPFDLVFYSNVPEAGEPDRFVHRNPDGIFQEIREPNTYEGLSFDKRPVILKLYGTADQIREREGDSVVITEEHYIEYLVSRNLSELLPVQLLQKLNFQKPHILFLGYPLGDWNQRIILHRIWKNLTLTKRYDWWAIQSKSEPFAQKLWQRYDVVLYDLSLRDYIEELAQRVREIPAKGD